MGFARSGPAALERLRAEGQDPTQGGEATRKRSASFVSRQREALEWERANGGEVNPVRFTTEILPLLQDIPLRSDGCGHWAHRLLLLDDPAGPPCAAPETLGNAAKLPRSSSRQVQPRVTSGTKRGLLLARVVAGGGHCRDDLRWVQLHEATTAFAPLPLVLTESRRG